MLALQPRGTVPPLSSQAADGEASSVPQGFGRHRGHDGITDTEAEIPTLRQQTESLGCSPI